MKTIILTAERASGSWPFDLVDTFGESYWTDPDRKAVTIGKSWMAVTRDDSEENYEHHSLALVRQKVINPSLYIVEPNSEEIVAEFILRAARTSTGLIDNDHGWIGWLDDYVAAISAGQSWLYAKQAQQQP